MTLDGRVAIVTGAGGAIGRDVTQRLTEAGATVVAADLEAPDFSAGARIDAIALDVTDTDAVASGVAGVVERHDRIDILVNVAGVYGHMQRADRIDPAQ